MIGSQKNKATVCSSLIRFCFGGVIYASSRNDIFQEMQIKPQSESDNLSTFLLLTDKHHIVYVFEAKSFRHHK